MPLALVAFLASRELPDSLAIAAWQANQVLVASQASQAHRDLAGSLENLARTYHLSFAPVHEHWKRRVGEGIDLGELVQFDGVHPTVMGYRLMAEAVMKIFV